MTFEIVSIEATISSITDGLLGRLRSRDEQAWSQLVRLYAPLVDEWCRRLQPADAENVCQEVFLAAHQAIDGFCRDSDRHTFGGWLRRITENKIRDFWRRASIQVSAEGGTNAQEKWHRLADQAAEQSDDGPLTADETKIVYARIMEFVRSEFHERTWRAFYEVVVLGRTPSDVALDLQMSVNAVHLAKGRVLRRIREWINDVQEASKGADEAGAP